MEPNARNSHITRYTKNNVSRFIFDLQSVRKIYNLTVALKLPFTKYEILLIIYLV